MIMTINEATTTITKTKARLTGSGTRLLVLLSALVAGLSISISISMMMVVAAPVADGDGEVNATMVGAQSAAEREQQQLWCQRRPNEVWSTLDACCQASCYDDAQTICKENKGCVTGAGCVCVSGGSFIRRTNDGGPCIPEDQCPEGSIVKRKNNNKKCQPNEVWETCFNGCEHSCRSLALRESVGYGLTCTLECGNLGCQCARGFVRAGFGDLGARCIPVSECGKGSSNNYGCYRGLGRCPLERWPAASTRSPHGRRRRSIRRVLHSRRP